MNVTELQIREIARDECERMLAETRELAQSNRARLIAVSGEDGRNGKIGELKRDIDAYHEGHRALMGELKGVESEMRLLDRRLFRAAVILAFTSIVGPVGVQRVLQALGW